MADYVGGDMIRGHIDAIILFSLVDGDKDTNEIREEIESRAEGQFQLKQGTFYSALQRIVKQGYVIEYRTTSDDGVRRKYFQLTEKGKTHIEQNQSSWTMSRQVINTLLDTRQRISKTTNIVKPDDENLPEFEVTNFSNLDDKAEYSEESTAQQIIASIGDIVESEETSIPDEQEIIGNTNVEPVVITSETPPSISDNISENLKPNGENQILSSENTPQTFDDILALIEDLNQDEVRQEQRKIQEEQEAEEARLKAEAEQKAREEQEAEEARLKAEAEQKAREEQEAADARLREEVEAARLQVLAKQQEENLQAERQSKLEEQAKEREAAWEKELEYRRKTAIIDPQKDDYLKSDNLPLQHEYKDVLSKIFGDNNKEKTQTGGENIIDFPTQDKREISDNNINAVLKGLDTQTPIESIASQEREEDFDVIVDHLDFNDNVENRKAEETAAGKTSGIDYTDIIALSKSEGFKVTTSDRTNKSELGKILINRLNFHSSLLFSLLLVLETILIGVTMDGVLKFGYQIYLYFGLIVLIFPIISSAIYYMAPKRTVGEVGAFKSSFETALIITLNLILMILVCAVIIDIDFSSIQDLSRFIFMPLLIVLNVPIYVVIRYSLLEKQMYFS